MNWTLVRFRLLLWGPFASLVSALVLSIWFWNPMHAVIFWGMLTLGIFSITLYYHRYLTHQSFEFRWFGQVVRAIFAWACVAIWQGRSVWWVAVHRRHHEVSDKPGDPHSPNDGFWNAHAGWIPNASYDSKISEYEEANLSNFCWLDRWLSNRWVNIIAGPVVAVVLAGLLGGFVGVLWYLGAVFVASHVTWSVNSLGHMWGDDSVYETGDQSRNIYVLAPFSGGELLHRGHHGQQRSCRFGHRWWEILLDTGYLLLRLLWCMGMVHKLKLPTKREIQARLKRKASYGAS